MSAKDFTKAYGKAATVALGVARGMDTLGQGGIAAGASEFGQITSKAIPNQKSPVSANIPNPFNRKEDTTPGGTVAAQSIRNRLRIVLHL